MVVSVTCMTLAVIAPAAASPAGASRGELVQLLARVDALWRERDAPGRLDEVASTLDRAEVIAPGDFDVLWRKARLDVWRSDDSTLDRGERSRLGKRAWDTAERAIAAKPWRVEGHLFAALGMGNYALSLGVVKALREGIEGKFKTRLRKVEAIDRSFLDGTVLVAWGRFYYELPWPKYDARKSEASLRKAIEVSPANLRARVYLAELYLKENRRDAAREQLREVLAADAGAYDAPEGRRMHARAREILSSLE